MCRFESGPGHQNNRSTRLRTIGMRLLSTGSERTWRGKAELKHTWYVHHEKCTEMVHVPSSPSHLIWILSSVGRAAPLQGVGRRFEPVRIHHLWKFGRVVYCSGLENRRLRKGSVGSNPTASASILKFSVCGKVWLIHLVGNQETAGSNPATLTMLCLGGGMGRHARLRS